MAGDAQYEAGAPLEHIMATTNKKSQNPVSGTGLGDPIPARIGERLQTRDSISPPRKPLSIMNGLMDLMVDGLAPAVKTQRRSYELIVSGPGPQEQPQ